MIDAALERSRRQILDAIGTPHDLTLVHGDRGPRDQLVLAGARGLLGELSYAQIRLGELPGASGHTALLAVGEGLARPDHELVARALRVAELRFERVIVLPSAVDPSEDAVREALARTRATVFAGDPISQQRAAGLCDARLAHDVAFFADYSDHRQPGTGGLDAFRTDSEQRLTPELPADNDDISDTRDELGAWLEAIRVRELVRTDRSEVLIAAAMLGKRVEYMATFDARLAALAEHWLAGWPVSALESSGPDNGRWPPPAELTPTTEQVLERLRTAALASEPGRPTTCPTQAPRVTAVIVSRNRARLAVRALDSLRNAGVPYDTVVVDNNSSPVQAHALAETCKGRDRLRFVRMDENTRAAHGRQLGSDLVETELLLFLDDDAELLPGALGHMIAELDANPEASAVSGTVVARDGFVMHSGGDVQSTAEVVNFSLVGRGSRFEGDALPPSGPTEWIATTAMVARTELLREFPMDPEMKAYFEDNEWAYRVYLERPGSFRRSREALALHQSTRKPVLYRTFAGRSLAIEWLAALARFYEVHGRLLSPWVFVLAPELVRPDGSWNVGGARLLMDVLLERGTDWVFTAWMNGALGGLLERGGYG